MDQLGIDPELSAVLGDADCPSSFYTYFRESTLEQLMTLTLPQLKSKLRSMLPVDVGDTGRKVVTRVLYQLMLLGDEDTVCLSNSANDHRPGLGCKAEVKTELIDDYCQQKVLNSDGDDIEIVGEVMKNRDVTYLGTNVKSEVQITLREDDLRGNTGKEGISSLSTIEPQQLPPSRRVLRSAATGKRKSRRILVNLMLSHDGIMIKSAMKKVQVPQTAAQADGFTTLKWNWTQFDPRTHVVDSLQCNSWSWSHADEHGVRNLYRLLQPDGNCNKISELTFTSNAQLPVEPTTGSLLLSALTILKVTLTDIGTEMNFAPQLKQIVDSSTLEQISVTSENPQNVQAIVDVLAQPTTRHSLLHLKSLFLSPSSDQEEVLLTEADVSAISNLVLPNLEDLQLRYCLSVDVKLEILLEAFAASLKNLKIDGCFSSVNKVVPKIEIKFPKMPNLQVLELGDGVEFDRFFETVLERPPNRPQRLLPYRQNSGKADSDVAAGPFPVTLILVPMPDLHMLALCSQYSLQEFHFSMFPSLVVFRVASDWHLTNPNHPIPAREEKRYPKLKHFQLPDRLSDYTFLHKIPTIFPNIEKIWINLPTVCVLRAFASAMKNSKTLHSVSIQTQFDFASSLEYCFVARAAQVSQSDEEKEKLKVLKEYVHHEEYVRQYLIEVPAFDADGEGFEGLHILKRMLTGGLVWEHVPRTLRLPMGHLKRDEVGCEFTDTIIGFKKIPMTKPMFDGTPLEFTGWNVHDLTGETDKRPTGYLMGICYASCAGATAVSKK